MQHKMKTTPAAAGRAELAAITQPEAAPIAQPVTTPSPFTGFAGIKQRYPFYGERTLRDLVARKILPACRPPGSRKLIFHLESCDKSLLRFQQGGIE